MKFTALSLLAVALLMSSEVEAVSLKQALSQIQSDSFISEHQKVLAELVSASKTKDFWDFLTKAGNWIKDAAHKVADTVGGLFKAQKVSRAYVNELAQMNGISHLPVLSLAELNHLGFNRNAFAQMQVDNMSDEDVRQVILLGLASDEVQ